MSDSIRAGSRRIAISHPDKVMFPAAGVTKGDLAEHYARVAPLMVPLVRDHPVAMQAFPRGVAGPGYYMKDVPAHFPDWIRRVTVAKRGGSLTHLLPNDAATLVYMANQNVITPHVWTARADKPREPDRIVFDFDPPGTRFGDVRAAARDLGHIVRDLGLEPFAMTSGSRGIHVVTPIRRGRDYEEVYAFARRVTGMLAEQSPRKLTTEFYKEKREGRIFLDIRRNAYAQHAVAPYAVRPRENAPVATPLRWEELDDPKLRPDRWTVRTIGRRIEDAGDPWEGFRSAARAIPATSARARGRAQASSARGR